MRYKVRKYGKKLSKADMCIAGAVRQEARARARARARAASA